MPRPLPAKPDPKGFVTEEGGGVEVLWVAVPVGPRNLGGMGGWARKGDGKITKG